MKPGTVLAVVAAGAVYVGVQNPALVTSARQDLTSASHHATSTRASLASNGSTGSSTSGGTLNCQGLERLWEAAGGSPGAAFTAAEVATAESSGQQYSTDNDSNGSTDRGYWQINTIWPGSTYDPMGNARAAVQISHNGTDWEPWVTYQTGAYEGKC